MTAAPLIQLIEVDDPEWELAQAESEPDPYCTRGFQAASSAVLGQRPVLIRARGHGWDGQYVLQLTAVAAGEWLARTPEYGGPWLRTESKVDAVRAANSFREALDGFLRELGVLSEVSLFSVWVPHAEAAIWAWNGRDEKQVCVARMDTLADRWTHLSKGRRSDINRAKRDLQLSWATLDIAGAQAFAAPYSAAMEAKDAAPRWRVGLEYFMALADEPSADLSLCSAEGPDGGAMGLFLRAGYRAAYLYAARWGRASGASSAVVWRAQEVLADCGVRELLLGGGISTDPADALLTFKRSLSDRVQPFQLAARAFDLKRHEAAIAAGAARPLPDGYVDA